MAEASCLYTLITGASSGIGRGIAARLAAERRLILHGRDLERLAATRDACANGASHLIWQQDFREADCVAGSLTQFLAENGAGVECFIHCAGMVKVLPARSTDYAVVREMMDVNYLSASEIVRTLISKRINQRNLASILFISSIWSRFGARGHSAYCATKGALDALMRALAAELAPDVRVNSILPGAVRTEMAAPSFDDPEVVARMDREYLLGIGEVEDVAAAAEFLTSRDARWITGHQMVVDGGRTADMSSK